VGSSTGTLRYVERGSEGGVSLCGSCVRGTWKEGSLTGDREGYVERALGTGISFHRSLVWENLEDGSCNGNFERWMKGLWGWSIYL